MAGAEPAASRPRSHGRAGAGRRTRSTSSTRRWSAPGRSTREPRRRSFADRLNAYMTKALREAKVHTSWLSPDEEYETRGARVRRRDPRSPAGPFLAGVPAVPGARRRARHLQQPRAAADQDHRARRARLLPGHRAVGSVARRSRQPAPGRLRAAARAARRADHDAGDRGRRAARAPRATAASSCS